MIREITTAEELDALPIGAVVLDATGWAWQRETAGRWRGDRGASAAPGVHLGPFTVLHVVVPDGTDVRERARLERAIERLWVAAVEYARVYQPDSEHVLRDDRDLLLAVVGQGMTAEPVAVVESIHEDRPVITARVYAPESWEHLGLGTHLHAAVRSGEQGGEV